MNIRHVIPALIIVDGTTKTGAETQAALVCDLAREKINERGYAGLHLILDDQVQTLCIGSLDGMHDADLPRSYADARRQSHAITVHVRFAYPGSVHACRFSYGNRGCWTVQIWDKGSMLQPEAIAGMPTIEDAVRLAEQTGLAWTPGELRDASTVEPLGSSEPCG